MPFILIRRLAKKQETLNSVLVRIFTVNSYFWV